MRAAGDRREACVTLGGGASSNMAVGFRGLSLTAAAPDLTGRCLCAAIAASCSFQSARARQGLAPKRMQGAAARAHTHMLPGAPNARRVALEPAGPSSAAAAPALPARAPPQGAAASRAASAAAKPRRAVAAAAAATEKQQAGSAAPPAVEEGMVRCRCLAAAHLPACCECAMQACAR